jgi:DnaJ-class molecular chaperone
LKSTDLERAAKFCEQGTKFLGAVKEFVQLLTPLMPPAEADPYQIVGVTPEDPWAMVEKVYRMKAKFLHPDTKETGNEEAYKRLQAAYATLKERRQP